MSETIQLIDTNEAKAWAEEHIGDVQKKCAVIDFLRDCPTRDAAPVIHARWVWMAEERPRLGDNPKFFDIVKHSFKYPYAPNEAWHCSHCKRPAVEHLAPYLVGSAGVKVLEQLRDEYKPSICPGCSAKMDLEEK